MGTDFKEKTKNSIKKSWDNAAIEANTPDLFLSDPDCSKPLFETDILDGQCVNDGQKLILRKVKNRFIGFDGNSPVVEMNNPTSEISDIFVRPGAMAQMQICKVDGISGVAEAQIK